MQLLWIKILTGAVIGVLIGLSGLGGAVVLLPILIFAFGVSPLVAVGSTAVFNAITKVGAGFVHWRQRTVDWWLVAALLLGSLPGTFLGVQVLEHLRTLYGAEVNTFLRLVVGAVLILVPLLLLVQSHVNEWFQIFKRPSQDLFKPICILGFVAGILVGMSSVGSGTIILMVLLLIVEGPPLVLLGTDIVHAVALMSFTGFLHFRMGTVDLNLVIPLLLGSIPGSLLGVRISTMLPGRWLNRLLCVLLLATGARMLWI